MFFKILLIFACAILPLFVVIFIFVEVFLARFRHEAPIFPSTKKLRATVISEIKRNFSDAKTVLDVGGGYGGLARKIAKNFPRAKVFAVEKKILPAFLSKIFDKISRAKNSKTVFGDAFKFIENSRDFDVGVAYLIPAAMQNLEDLRGKFRALLVLDFPLPHEKPSRKIEICKEFKTRHFLYIYK